MAREAHQGARDRAIDVGTGTGVLTLQMAKAGFKWRRCDDDSVECGPQKTLDGTHDIHDVIIGRQLTGEDAIL